MRPEEYLAILRRRWWLPVLCGVLAGAVAYVWTMRQPSIYESSTRVMAIAAPNNPEQVYWIDLYAKNRLESYRQVAASEDLARQAMEQAGLPWSAGDLLARLSTRHNPNDNTVQLAVRDADPALAAQAVNALADALVACLNSAACRLSPPSPQVLIVRLDTAGVPTQPTGVQPRLNAAGGLVLGVVAGALLAVLLEYIDDVIRTPSDLRRATSFAVLARVPMRASRRWQGRLRREGDDMAADRSTLVMLAHPASAAAEAYRVLRTNVLFARAERPLNSLVVAGIGEDGTSDVAANLAVAIAQTGMPTILVDADLRHPALHRYFGASNDKGLATALTTDAAPGLEATTVPNLSLLPAGPAPVAPSEALSSTRFTQVLGQIAPTGGDMVIVLDAPPIGRLADSVVLATRADAVLLVVRAGKTRRAAAEEARDTLARVGAHVVGVALVE